MLMLGCGIDPQSCQCSDVLGCFGIDDRNQAGKDFLTFVN